MADFIERAGSFMADPWGMGSSFTGGLAKSLGMDNNADIDSAQGTLDDVLAKANSTAAQNRNIYNNYMNQMQGMFGNGAAQYADAVQRLSDAIGNGPDTFTATGSMNDFYDPFANQRAAQAMDAINRSASSGGNRFSSSYNDALAAKQQALSSEEWSKAFDRWMTDRSRQLAEWQAGQGAKQNYLSNIGNVANMYGQDRTNLANAIGDYNSALANQNNADLEVYSDIAQNKANLDTQRKGGVGAMLGPVGELFGAIF